MRLNCFQTRYATDLRRIQDPGYDEYRNRYNSSFPSHRGGGIHDRDTQGATVVLDPQTTQQEAKMLSAEV